MAVMRAVILTILFAATLPAADDPKQIVTRALQFHERNDELARNYTFLRRTEIRALDGSGKVRHNDCKTHDITLLEGSPYTRLVARDDKPLPPKEEQQQQAELQRSIEQRRKETPEQRQQRVAEWDRRRKAQREELKEVPEAYDFRLVGEETIEGEPAWIIEGTPRPGYKPKSKQAGYYKKLKGRIWITKSDYMPVKIEAESTDTISMGAFVIRFQKGARFTVDIGKVNGEVWLPKHVWFTGDVRLLLVKGMKVNTDIAFTNYKKFTAESRIVSTAAQ
jgi:hypothetical protein